jgi:hypothetical protein
VASDHPDRRYPWIGAYLMKDRDGVMVILRRNVKAVAKRLAGTAVPAKPYPVACVPTEFISS